VKRATLLISLLLLATATAREKWPVFIAFSETELRHAKQVAIRAMNSPEAWRGFPSRSHERHYTPVLSEISFAYSTSHNEGETVTVIVPTTHIGSRHRALIYATFNHRGKLLDLDEVPEI
jgi:hypothetical protein